MAQLELSQTGRRKTPTVLYMWVGAILTFLAISALLSFLAIQTMSASGSRIVNSTGPVVISTQGLVASIAEADAANTAVFLSGIDGGIEDVSQRRLYESALARAPQQIEDISAGIGDDETTHNALKQVALQLTEYAGVVERARLANANDLDGAIPELEESLDLTGGPNGMLRNASEITTRTQDQFSNDIFAGGFLWAAAGVFLVVTLILLVIAQVRLRTLTKRLVNFGLVTSTVFVVVLTVWLAAATIGRQADLDNASNEASLDIAASASLQASAFEYKTQETGAIIRESRAELPNQTTVEAIDESLRRVNELADSNRERALAVEVQTRWDRYLDASGVISARVLQGNFAEARAEVSGEGNQTFNGFNTSLEALLLLNQEQFDASVTSAESRLEWLNYGALILPFLAGVAAWLGYRPRINEYF